MSIKNILNLTVQKLYIYKYFSTYVFQINIINFSEHELSMKNNKCINYD